MTVIIRRDRRRSRRGRALALVLVLVATLVVAGLGGMAALAWQKGGPRPVHEISYEVSAPKVAG